MLYRPTEHTFLTHTFSECVENHAGMETIGTKRDRGLSTATLLKHGALEGGEVHRLSHGDERASVVVFRNGVDKLLGEGGADALFRESTDQAFDDKFLNVKRKVVQNKHGRLNNCYADQAQAPDIPNGRGTVIAFNSAPCMKKLRAKLPALLGKDVEKLYAESNLYTDVRKKAVGIGFHGDTERSVVVGVRLGKAQQPLRFLWYQKSKVISKEHVIKLNHGDIYAMSWKATGHDWKRSSLKTLRHGVGRKAITKAIGK